MFPRAISFRIFCPNFHESRPKIPAILPMTLPYPFIIFPDHKSLLKFTESLGLVFLSYLLIEFSQWRRWRLVLVVRAQFFLTICWNGEVPECGFFVKKSGVSWMRIGVSWMRIGVSRMRTGVNWMRIGLNECGIFECKLNADSKNSEVSVQKNFHSINPIGP